MSPMFGVVLTECYDFAHRNLMGNVYRVFVKSKFFITNIITFFGKIKEAPEGASLRLLNGATNNRRNDALTTPTRVERA